MRALLVICVALFASVVLVQADLPIHCLNNQVAGTWVFKLTAESDKADSCGYHAPDVNALHFTKQKNQQIKVARKLTYTLVQPNQVHDAAGKVVGHWTMVYDEGFEVNADGYTFFAFNAYKAKPHVSLSSEDVNDYVSFCDKTMVGWFRNKAHTKWGCYKAVQTATLRFRATESEAEETTEESALTAPAPAAAPIAFNPNHVVSPFAFDAESTEHPVGTSGDTEPEPTAFYQLESITSANRHRNVVSRNAPVDADAMFVPDMSFLEAHNRDHQSTWKAGLHEQFLGKRMSEMMRLLGRRTYNKQVQARATHTSGARGAGSGDAGPGGADPNHRSAKYVSELQKLPREYSWIKYDSPVRNQGECGSCYSLAAMTVYETRLRIKSQMKDKTIMSGQDVLSCSRTNQGCEGGYPFLVGKHAAEFGLVSEACVPYKASDISCDSVKFTSSKCASRRYFARNYRYVGGYYGSCNELLMMKEIMRNGPVIVAFQAPGSLFYYHGGIFTGPPPKHEGVTEHGVRYWEQTNHAVVAMGWGEENGHKYWIIKNTWGPKWGEKGYFRIQRGTDECGIESMATTFDVVL